MQSKTRFILRAWVLAGLTAFLDAAEPAPRLELRNEQVTLALGRAEHGAMVSLQSSDRQEFIAAAPPPVLFALTFSPAAATPGERFTLSSREAGSFTADLRRESQRQVATLAYTDFRRAPVRVTCTASLADGDPLVRWRLAIQVPAGLVLEAVRFPIVTLHTAAAEDAAGDALVLGASKGGVIRRPGAMKAGATFSLGQPGNLAAQFGCLYSPRAGVLTAAFDGAGHPKNLVATRVRQGLELSWQRAGFATGQVTQDYDVVLTAFAGTDSRPADWRDAADIYKRWALTQPWCATTYDRRADLPDWIKQGPAMVRFGRDWLAEPARIDRWMTEFWRKQFPAVPLIMAFWGWEKIGNWVTPDYFPVFPSDAEFTALVARMRAAGAHAFPWPSGYHWTLTYRQRAEGGFEWDDRARFAAVARAHAVQTRAGQVYSRTPSWLAGGKTSCLCAGDPWTQRWWNEEICVPLAQRGCELIQIDQVVGGSFPACYDPTHAHPRGPGRWQTASFSRQLQTMQAALRPIQPEAVVCFEEPNEWFNHLVGLQDYRDCESPHEWASVFNYLYHEFLPPFQSNPRSDDLMAIAHCLVEGQIPHLVPSARDLGELLPTNGGFEPRGPRRAALAGWEQVPRYQGVEWTGQATSDEHEKLRGEASLRLENSAASDIVQISQNVAVGAEDRGAIKRYRLSAWLKTDHMAQPNAIGFGLFGPGMKSLGAGGRLPFPAAGSGWQRVSAEFTIPTGADRLRIMIHVIGPALAWADDLALEEILPGGGTQPARFTSGQGESRLMQRWITLYHGEGRPWLQFGRLLHPPKLTVGTTRYEAVSRLGEKHVRTERTMPAVLHNAFRAPDGTEAVVLANPTRDPQAVVLEWQGRTRALTVPPADALVIR